MVWCLKCYLVVDNSCIVYIILQRLLGIVHYNWNKHGGYGKKQPLLYTGTMCMVIIKHVSVRACVEREKNNTIYTVIRTLWWMGSWHVLVYDALAGMVACLTRVSTWRLTHMLCMSRYYNNVWHQFSIKDETHFYVQYQEGEGVGVGSHGMPQVGPGGVIQTRGRGGVIQTIYMCCN